MKIFISYFEDGTPSITFDGKEIQVAIDIPEDCEKVIKTFLQFQGLLENGSDKGVSLEILMSKIFDLGRKWSG